MEGLRFRLARYDLRRLAMAAYVVFVGVFASMRALGIHPWDAPGVDIYAYWMTRDGLDYPTAHAGETGAYLYSPVFAQAIAPLAALPWPAFLGLWTALVALILLWLGGWYALLLAAVPIVFMSIVLGQLDLAFAAVAVLGFRWPAVWALPLLTKVSPGVGLVWFLVRREWRSLGIALGATFGIAAISFVLDPREWIAWLELLRRMEFPAFSLNLIFVPLPLWLRLPAAAVLVAWGAATDRRWTVPAGMCLAMPMIWLNAPTILVALLPLAGAGAMTPAGRWLRVGGVVGASSRVGRTIPGLAPTPAGPSPSP